MIENNKISPKEFEEFLKGNGTPQLKEEVECWLSENGHSKSATDLLTDLWDNTHHTLATETIQSAFAQFKKRISIQQTTLSQKVMLWCTRIAAIALIPIIIYSLFFSENESPTTIWKEKYVNYGTREELILPDGSHVWLNSGTHVIYPESFDKKHRQIFITGEAYLDVKKDLERPFVVSTGTININVLGTEFNVKSYIEDENITISLIDGAVSVSEAHDTSRPIAVMAPGEMIAYNKDDRNISLETFSKSNYTFWKEGNLFFRNEKLSNITTHLERLFDVKIAVHNKKLRDKKFYVAFMNNETLDQMLDALNIDGQMIITQKENRLIEINHK